MVFAKNFLLAILQGALVILPLLIQADPDRLGFISIDCGISEVLSYTDETTGISYISDSNFTNSGKNNEILLEYKTQTADEKQFWNVRSFPEGTRNCYTLKPEGGKGSKYLIRARFMYGNYDNKDQASKFDLYLGVNLWDTVKIDDASSIINKEIMHVSSSDHIHVCLVNTGHGIPFISVLELRPLPNDIYVSEAGSLQLLGRSDFASETDRVTRYEDDIYDRLWSPSDVFTPLSTSLRDENSITKNNYQVPFSVMSTACTLNRSNGGDMGFYYDSYQTDRTSTYYIYLHFAELEQLRDNQYREFNIDINNGDFSYESLVPKYLDTITKFSDKGTKPDSEGIILNWLNSTENSTLPPLINALEIYELKELSHQETSQTDVDAMMNIKTEYEVKRNWQGDPCAPKDYSWDGLDCSYNNNSPPLIISLNFSSSGLKGEISPYIANLTMLQYLYLSNNSLSGTVPEFLAQLSFLRVLDLKGNNLTGPVPAALLERSKNGLSLRVDANLIGNEASSSPEYTCRKNQFVVPLVTLFGGFLFMMFHSQM